MGGLVAVTGAFGALGKKVTAHLMSVGFDVAAIDLNEPEELPSCRLVLSHVDLSEAAPTEHAFKRLKREGEPLAGLVNIAGGFAWEKVAGASLETWDRMYRINLLTAVNACKAALPLMVPESSIINIGALGATNPAAGMAAYAASKSGVARLTESLAAEVKGRGIRVNALLPSIIDTPANRRDMPDADTARWVTPEALARIIAFFLSADSLPITGASVPVPGA